MISTIDMQDMRYLNLFNKITRINTRFCFMYNETIIFCIPKQLISKAVGQNGNNVKKIDSEQYSKILEYIRDMPDSRVSNAQFREKIKNHFLKTLKKPYMGVLAYGVWLYYEDQVKHGGIQKPAPAAQPAQPAQPTASKAVQGYINSQYIGQPGQQITSNLEVIYKDQKQGNYGPYYLYKFADTGNNVLINFNSKDYGVQVGDKVSVTFKVKRHGYNNYEKRKETQITYLKNFGPPQALNANWDRLLDLAGVLNEEKKNEKKDEEKK